ncbi:MAG: hypothetical protein FD164_1140 [Nitrospirae bacterium]|nr:MAG: hypothetical protein FD164_1140 [Nitrospirota bacterium]
MLGGSGDAGLTAQRIPRFGILSFLCSGVVGQIILQALCP